MDLPSDFPGQGRPEKFGGPGQNLTWGPLKFYIVVVLSVRGVPFSPGKILKSEVLEIAKSCTLSGYLSLFLLHTSFSFYVGPPLAGGPGQIAPFAPPPPSERPCPWLLATLLLYLSL